MAQKNDNLHGVSREIEELVEAGKNINLILEKGNIAYERAFTPTSRDTESGIVLYRHIKNTYTSIRKPSGNVYRLTERKNMPDTSNIHNAIYATLKVLEKSGYILKESTDWEVI